MKCIFWSLAVRYDYYMGR